MAVHLPSISIIFRQLAGTFIQRSARGVAALIVKDDTVGKGGPYYRFGDATQIPEGEFTAQNEQYIRDALSFGPLRVAVVKIGASGQLAQALAVLIQREQTGWVTVCGGASKDWTDLTSWIKAREKEEKSWKAVVYNASAPDCMHIVNLTNANVVFADGRGKQTGDKYTPSLAGLLAACNVERGATNALCPNLTSVEAPEDPETAVGSGKFILINVDDQVRVGVDVNSLTMVDGSTRTEDMKYIETVEAMDMMRDDIAQAFRQDYMGKYRNSTANQMLFLAAVNEYFRQLGEENVLDPEHDNTAQVDVESQRNAWIGAGKAEAADWDDGKVLATPFKRQLFLAGDVKILGTMADLRFVVTLM